MTDEPQQPPDNSPQINSTQLSGDTPPTFNQQAQQVGTQINVAGNYIEATTSKRFYAPAPPAHFTGREDDLAKFAHLLTTGETVAITALHGMGGIGKTSLALKLAERVQDQFLGGVLWWSLGSNPDVITALDVWARHADPRADLTALPTAEARAEVVRPLLARLGKLCVIIDDVWDANSFNVLHSAIPAGCPLLMTTRDADLAKSLRCRVERIDALSDDEAVSLLMKLLGSLGEHEHVAYDIAHLTEGLPLALELIAGLADSPTDLPALAQRLKDKPPLDLLKRGTTREQSIETCFTLSYEHLNADLQRRFCALGVFALAPFEREAIAAVWDEENETVDQSISQLVRRSLLSKVDGTVEYRQHALLHDYALRLLSEPSPLKGEGGRAALDKGDSPFARYADYYHTFAKTQDWRAVEHFFDQIEHGWQWVQANAPEQIIEYVFAVWHFLDTRGRKVEVLKWLQVALVQARAANGREDEGAILNNIGTAYDDLGQKDKAFDTYQQALAIIREVGGREVGNHFGEGALLHNIGLNYKARGQMQEALDTYQQALVIHREVGDRAGEGTTLNNIGAIYKARGQIQEALNTFQQALTICQEVGNRSGEATTLHNLGSVYDDLGQKDEALDTYQKTLAIRREVGDCFGESVTLNNIGAIHRARGQMQEALDIYEQALAICCEVGDRSGVGTILNNIGLAYRALGHQNEALDFYTQALAIFQKVRERWSESALLSNIGLLLDAMGLTAEAVLYLEQCVALMKELGHPNLEANRAALGRVMAKLAAP